MSFVSMERTMSAGWPSISSPSPLFMKSSGTSASSNASSPPWRAVLASSTAVWIRSSGAAGLCRNALTAMDAAPRNLPRLNFIIVTMMVPPSTTNSDGVFTKVPADPPRKIEASTMPKAPTRPISVARSNSMSSLAFEHGPRRHAASVRARGRHPQCRYRPV